MMTWKRRRSKRNLKRKKRRPSQYRKAPKRAKAPAARAAKVELKAIQLSASNSK
jgi:hypothetical protein